MPIFFLAAVFYPLALSGDLCITARCFLSPRPVRARMKVRVRLQRPARFKIPPPHSWSS